MGRVVIVSCSLSTQNPVIPLDPHVTPFQISILVVPTSTGAAASAHPTIQHTYDNVLTPGFVTANAVWQNHPTLVSCSVTISGHYTGPVMAIRPFTSVPGNYTVYVLQAGI